jgi:hypothetical protein
VFKITKKPWSCVTIFVRLIPKGANRMRISQKNRQHNGKMKKDNILILFSQDYVGSKYYFFSYMVSNWGGKRGQLPCEPLALKSKKKRGCSSGLDPTSLVLCL